MKPRILNWLAIGIAFLPSCTGENGVMPQTRCNAAIAVATQIWQVDYYISKTSGGFNSRRTHSFQSNTLTNLNGEKPATAVSGQDDEGVWWAALPPRPTADEVDQHRDIQEQNDPPLLQRSVDYQLRCDETTLLTNALTYREVSRSVRAGQAVRVSYVGNRVLKIEMPK
ncbi:hypothetical protein FM036_33905 [Nostoc sp. HG1]|nr:hypothetical protein [Nostoc sp. HG1]